MGKLNTEELLGILTAKLDEKLAIDIKALELKGICDFADIFLIASASNPNQLKTLVDTAEEVLVKNEIPYSIEGRGDSGWVLIDCIDIIIHIFGTEEREFYNLEHMWQDGSFIDIEKYLPARTKAGQGESK